jgi:hypothetical protein
MIIKIRGGGLLIHWISFHPPGRGGLLILPPCHIFALGFASLFDRCISLDKFPPSWRGRSALSASLSSWFVFCLFVYVCMLFVFLKKRVQLTTSRQSYNHTHTHIHKQKQKSRQGGKECRPPPPGGWKVIQ